MKINIIEIAINMLLFIMVVVLLLSTLYVIRYTDQALTDVCNENKNLCKDNRK